jgi:hypothetical protein
MVMRAVHTPQRRGVGCIDSVALGLSAMVLVPTKKRTRRDFSPFRAGSSGLGRRFSGARAVDRLRDDGQRWQPGTTCQTWSGV